MEELLLCPKCRGALGRREKSLVCSLGHTYDIARQGYVNLLLGSAALHGDNREMIAARRMFLEKGLYASLRHRVAELAAGTVPSQGVILDAGCGECYYTEAVAQACLEKEKEAAILGFDVSKEAILAGSRRRCASLFTASSYDIPLRNSSVDLILCMFAPLATEEFYRILRPEGRLLLAVPGRRHLWEMKKVLYDTPYENQPQASDPKGFLLEERIPVEERVFLEDPETIASLFAMTPYFYRTPKAGRERLSALSSLETEISFEILLYRRRESPEA